LYVTHTIIWTEAQVSDVTDDPGLSYGRLDALIGFHLRMASAAVARDFAAAMDELGLTQKQCAVLELIAANPQSSQIDLAAALGTDRATIMALVDRLDTRGLITRAASSRDRRRQELGLNAKGAALLQGARRRIAAHEAGFRRRLGAAKTEKLMALLKDVYS
jgi:DNA-binding MarR family transcriptional regulator